MTSRGTQALDVIFEPWTRDGEGFLHLWLGNTRMGKTYANNILVTETFRRNIVDMAFTIDDKNPAKPQYRGTYRANPNGLHSDPLHGSHEARHVVFRGVAYRSDLADSVNHGDVAALVWGIKRTTPKCRLLLNIDELADATNGHQNWNDDQNAQIYRKGAGVGISTTATTQMPQALPREAFGLSQTIAMFQLDAREVTYLDNYRIITPEMGEILPKLQRGDFVLYRRGGGGWDGKVYRF